MRFNAMRMLIFTVSAAVALVFAAGFTVPAAQAQDPCGETVTVQEGDTLIDIANLCNTTVNAILQVNPDVDPRALAIGTVLTMPSGQQAGSANMVLAIAPTAGPPGTQVRVIANNLQPNTPYEVGIGRPESEYDVIAQAPSDGFGTLSQYITVPEYLGTDPWVVVLNNPNNATELIAPSAQPVVAIAPTQGLPGSSIQLIANGFPANTEVEIGVGLWQSETDVRERVTTNEAGTVEAAVTIPEFASGDERWVALVATPDGSLLAESALFHVSTEPAAPQPTATPFDTPVPTATLAAPTATPTSTPTVTPVSPTAVPTATPVPGDAPVYENTNIYMIALNDAGQSGPMLACNDSAVAVEIPIAATTAPLTAALENLLAVSDEFYGGSGLYNALHASELALNVIELDRGHATIRLTGIMRETRLCDWQRIKAQIMQTALQYDTVNSVSVYLNGNQM